MEVVRHFFVRKEMTGIDKPVAVLALLFLVWAYVVPTSRFIHPIGLSFSDRMGQFTRSTPFGSVYAAWAVEMNVAGFECYDGRAEPLTLYQDNGTMPGQVVTTTYTTPSDLSDCFDILDTLDFSQHFTITHTHQVFVLGHLPLRPMYTSWICRNRGADCDLAENGGAVARTIAQSRQL